MKKYDEYIIENDWILKRRSHLFYLCGYVKDENCVYVIASYSVKTDKLLIKCASEHIPPTNVLQDFVKHAIEVHKDYEKC